VFNGPNLDSKNFIQLSIRIQRSVNQTSKQRNQAKYLKQAFDCKNHRIHVLLWGAFLLEIRRTGVIENIIATNDNDKE
jgi:hypothetical protein